MDLADSPQEAAFRAEARAWLEAHVTEDLRSGLYEEGDQQTAERRGREWQRTLFDAGWAAITWPAAYGGRGLGPVEQIIWNQELSRSGAPQTIAIIGIGMAGPTIIAHGTEEQKSRYLTPMLRGDEVWCQLFSEPGAGSDLAGLSTRAERQGDEWVVNGQKVWSSGAHYSNYGILLARSDPSLPKHRGLTFFILDMRSPGVDVRPLRQLTGGAHFNEVFLTDVRIPDSLRVGDVNDGWRVAMTTLLNERMALGGVEGMFSFDRLAEFARTLHPDGVDPVLRQELARLYAWVRCLDLLNARVISKLGRGQIPESEGSVMKLALGRLVAKGAELGLAVQGGWAAVEDGPSAGSWQHLWLSAPAFRIGGGTDEIQRNIISERVLGMPREPRPDRDLPFDQTAAQRGGS